MKKSYYKFQVLTTCIIRILLVCVPFVLKTLPVPFSIINLEHKLKKKYIYIWLSRAQDICAINNNNNIHN